jgi:hypothetical protein
MTYEDAMRIIVEDGVARARADRTMHRFEREGICAGFTNTLGLTPDAILHLRALAERELDMATKCMDEREPYYRARLTTIDWVIDLSSAYLTGQSEPAYRPLVRPSVQAASHIMSVLSGRLRVA